MRVLLPLVRAVCDERLNIHGVQATTHFAAPLVIINGPIRNELGFAYRQNAFSNVARANSTLGRALQLILLNIGGARPDAIDMSTLGNPGKFCYCIAEHEEANPWEPFHVERGFQRQQSALTLFAAEAPHGVSEHTARTPEQVLKSISYALATVWTYRACLGSGGGCRCSPRSMREPSIELAGQSCGRGSSCSTIRACRFAPMTTLPTRKAASSFEVRDPDRRRVLLPEVPHPRLDSHRGGGRDCGENFLR